MNLNAKKTAPERAPARIEPALFGGCRGDTTDGNTGTQNSSGPVADRQLSSCNPLGRIRIIRFISSEERRPLNVIYKHALVIALRRDLLESTALHTSKYD
jgi:hypothetical protein